VDLRLGSPIVFAFGLAQKGCAFIVLNLNCVFCLSVDIRNLTESKSAQV